jgi:hypothetical protein
VAGLKAPAIVPVEILVERNGILPVQVFLKFLGSAIDGTLTVRVAEKNIR